MKNEQSVVSQQQSLIGYSDVKRLHYLSIHSRGLQEGRVNEKQHRVPSLSFNRHAEMCSCFVQVPKKTADLTS